MYSKPGAIKNEPRDFTLEERLEAFRNAPKVRFFEGSGYFGWNELAARDEDGYRHSYPPNILNEGFATGPFWLNIPQPGGKADVAKGYFFGHDETFVAGVADGDTVTGEMVSPTAWAYVRKDDSRAREPSTEDDEG